MNEESDSNRKTTTRRRHLLRDLGNSNEIAQLEKEIEEYQEKLIHMGQEKYSIELEVRNAEEKLAALESRLRSVTAEIDKLQSNKEAKARKKEKSRREKIDSKADHLFQSCFSELDSYSMQISISFGPHSGVFNISEETCGQFKDLKEIVAPFFNIQPEEIFFLDRNGVILEQNLKIKETLYPLQNKIIKDYLPQLTIILRKYQSMGDHIKQLRLREAEKIEERPQVSLQESIVEKYYFNRNASSKSEIKQQKKFDFMGCIKLLWKSASSLIFLGIILLWTFNMFNENRYFQSNLMNHDIEAAFHNPLSSNLTNSANLIILDWVRIIKQPAKTKSCLFLSDLYKEAYQNNNKTCYDPTQIDTTPFSITVEGKTETFTYFTDTWVTLDTLFGDTPTQGFYFDLDLSTPNSTQSERYTKWQQHFSMVRFESAIINVYNPSTQLLAQVHIYNKTFNSENIESVSNVDSVSLKASMNSQLGVRIALIILSSLAIIFNILSLVRPVSQKSALNDAEILLKQEYNKRITLGLPPPKLPYVYWFINFRYFVLLVYRPTQDQLISLVTMIALLTNVGLRSKLYNELSSLKIFEMNHFIDFNYYVNQKNNLLVLSAVVTLFLLATFIKALKALLQSVMPEVTYYEEMLKKLVMKLSPVIIVMAYILSLVAIANMLTFGMYNAEYNSFLNSFANAMEVALRSSKTNTNTFGNSFNDSKAGSSVSKLMHPVITVIILVYVLYNLVIVQSTVLIQKERSKIKETQGLFERIKAKGAKIFKFPVGGGPGKSVADTILTDRNPMEDSSDKKDHTAFDLISPMK